MPNTKVGYSSRHTQPYYKSPYNNTVRHISINYCLASTVPITP